MVLPLLVRLLDDLAKHYCKLDTLKVCMQECAHCKFDTMVVLYYLSMTVVALF
jgi:hypothetical protein